MQKDIKMKAKKKEKKSETKTSKKKKKKKAASKKQKKAEKEQTSSQLYERSWSVVNFEACLASGLTYDEAFKKLQSYAKENISGLCIITDEAAKRINKKQ